MFKFKNQNITNKINDGTKLVAFDLLLNLREGTGKVMFLKSAKPQMWYVTLIYDKFTITENIIIEHSKPSINTVIELGLEAIKGHVNQKATEYFTINALLSEYLRESK